MPEEYKYEKRYLTRLERIDNRNHAIKQNIFDFLKKRKFTLRLIYPMDRYSYKNREWNQGDEEDDKSPKLELQKIMFLEVLEIDEFDRYQDKIISTFSKHANLFKFFGNEREELIKALSKIKESLGTISFGRLFSLNYQKENSSNTDLISYVQVNYLKTTESYFIIQVVVTPSKKFTDIFGKINNSVERRFDKIKYRSFWEILIQRRFVKHYNTVFSGKAVSVENLISDITSQTKSNVMKYFQGQFFKSGIPNVQYYEISNTKDFVDSRYLRDHFQTDFDGHYTYKDEGILIFPSIHRGNDLSTKIVKASGHGKRVDQRENDLSNYSEIETDDLLRALVFPCAFQNTLSLEEEKLKELKREIYDFGNESRKFLSRRLTKRYYRRYVKLKQRLAHVLMITKRFEEEVTPRTLHIFTEGFDLDNFQPLRERSNQTKNDLRTKIVNDIKEDVKRLETTTRNLNEIFKYFEELYSHRTNYILQLTSIFVAVLAIIFTFDLKKTIVQLYHWILTL